MKDHKSRIEKLRRVRSLFEYLDKLPQLEKEPYLQSRDETTQKKISEVLERLEQLEPKLIGEDTPYHVLLEIPPDYRETEEVLSRFGINNNPDETYAWAYPRGFTEVRGYTGLPNISVNILTQSRPNTLRMSPSLVPEHSFLEFLVIY